MHKPFAITKITGEAFLSSPQRGALYQVFWFTQGEGTLVIDFKPYAVQENTVFFVSAGQVYEARLTRAGQGLHITFSAEFLYARGHESLFLARCNILDPTNNQLYVQLTEAELPVFTSLFYLLRREYDRPVAHFRTEILHNHLLSLILQAEQLRMERGGAYLPVDDDCRVYMRFRDALEERFQQDQRVGAYAQRLQVPAKKLGRAVARTLGKSAGQVITERVMLEAKRLLRHTPLSIKEIAGQLGFDEPSYFSRVFKRLVRQTPGQFRDE